MKQYKVTIIIPHYNIPFLLKKLLSTIPKREDLQIIIVDDNSSPQWYNELKKVVSCCGHPNTLLLKNYTMANSPGTCRNIGLENAGGEWILFADSDDYYVDGWLDLLLPHMEEDYEMIYFKPTSTYVDSGKKASRHEIFADSIHQFCADPNRKNELILRYHWTSVWMCAYRFDFLKKYDLLFGNTIRAEDTLFVVKCGYYAKKWLCLDENIYCVTVREGSITTLHDKELIKQHICTRIRKSGFLCHHLSDDDILQLQLEYAGLKIWKECISNFRNPSDLLLFYQLMKKEKVPFIMWRLFRSRSFANQIASSLQVR